MKTKAKLSQQQRCALERVARGGWDMVPPTTLRSLVRRGLVTYTPICGLTPAGRKVLDG